MVQYGTKVYHITREEAIVALDLTEEANGGDFAGELVGSAPPTFTNPRMCAVVEIDGEPGGLNGWIYA